MTWTRNFSVTIGAAIAMVGNSLSINSAFQPMTAVSTQPNFWDFYTVIFKRYRTLRTDINLKITNQGPVGISVNLVSLGDTPIGTFTTIQSVREIPWTHEYNIAQAGSMNHREITKVYTMA